MHVVNLLISEISSLLLPKTNLAIYLLSFVETARKFILAELSIRIISTIRISIISTDEDPSLRIESSAIINLRGVSTKLNKYIVFTMQTYKKLKSSNVIDSLVIQTHILSPQVNQHEVLFQMSCHIQLIQ